MSTRQKLIILLLLGVVLFFGVGIAAAEYKIGIVDITILFQQYYKTQNAQTEFNKKVNSFQDELNKRNTDILQLESELETQKTMLTPGKIDEKTKIIDQKKQDLTNFYQEGSAQLDQENKTMVGALLKEIQETIAQYARDKSYDFILNKRLVIQSGQVENEWDIVVYAADKFDLTNTILDILNAPIKKK